ncbi:hypothetical protein [Paenibacillus sp. GYB003]|uniref:hypothetical protein n=1 Tax=Paenibacillus sp. GYB003 TaxID=2994392 RepID=UPI002F96E4B5
MKAVKLRPFIPSGDNYELAQRFFKELGFTKLYADAGLSIFRVGEQEFFLQNIHNRELQDNYMLELVVERLDEWWSRIEAMAKSGEFPMKAKEPTLYPWGKREIHLIDPAGVCWHISEASRA